jgi:hypothetical protein
MGEGKMFSPEEMVNLTEKRIETEADLIRGGANIEVDDKGNQTNLILTEQQKNLARNEMDDALMTEEERFIAKAPKNAKENLLNILNQIKEQNIEEGDVVQFTLKDGYASPPMFFDGAHPYYGISVSLKDVNRENEDLRGCSLAVPLAADDGYRNPRKAEQIDNIYLLKKVKK